MVSAYTPRYLYTLPFPCLWSLFPRDEVQTLPGWSTQSPVGAHTSRLMHTLPGWYLWSQAPLVVHSPPTPCFRLGLDTCHTSMGAPDGWVTWWRGAWSCCCRGIPQHAPKGIFLFGKILLLNPATPSIQGRACPLAQPTCPARPGLSKTEPHTTQLSTLPSRHPWSP